MRATGEHGEWRGLLSLQSRHRLEGHSGKYLSRRQRVHTARILYGEYAHLTLPLSCAAWKMAVTLIVGPPTLARAPEQTVTSLIDSRVSNVGTREDIRSFPIVRVDACEILV